MEKLDLENRFDYHQPRDDETKRRHEQVRAVCLGAALDIDGLLPEGREKSLAVTKLEEAMMWANAGIARAPQETHS